MTAVRILVSPKELKAELISVIELLNRNRSELMALRRRYVDTFAAYIEATQRVHGMRRKKKPVARKR